MLNYTINKRKLGFSSFYFILLFTLRVFLIFLHKHFLYLSRLFHFKNVLLKSCLDSVVVAVPRNLSLSKKKSLVNHIPLILLAGEWSLFGFTTALQHCLLCKASVSLQGEVCITVQAEKRIYRKEHFEHTFAFLLYSQTVSSLSRCC